MGRLTTHVLDIANGRPGAGVRITLYRNLGERYMLIGDAVTNRDGRCDVPLLEGDAFTNGRYRLVFAVGQAAIDEVFTFVLSLTPLRRIMKDYFVVCESYYQAIRTAPPSRIQSIDMGRRALHDEGSRVLVERLKGKVTVDRDTSRRLFTLICALHWKG